MNWTPQLLKELHEALVNAFNLDSLERMVLFQLERKLYEEVERGNLSKVAFDLIAWAERGHWTSKLLTAARQANSTNQQLKALEDKIRRLNASVVDTTVITVVSPDVPPTTSITRIIQRFSSISPLSPILFIGVFSALLVAWTTNTISGNTFFLIVLIAATYVWLRYNNYISKRADSILGISIGILGTIVCALGIVGFILDSPPTPTPAIALPTPPNTPITPTNTPITPTNTPITPTNTPITPTNTPITPTNTPITPTNTPITLTSIITPTETSQPTVVRLSPTSTLQPTPAPNWNATKTKRAIETNQAISRIPSATPVHTPNWNATGTKQAIETAQAISRIPSATPVHTPNWNATGTKRAIETAQAISRIPSATPVHTPNLSLTQTKVAQEVTPTPQISVFSNLHGLRNGERINNLCNVNIYTSSQEEEIRVGWDWSGEKLEGQYIEVRVGSTITSMQSIGVAVQDTWTAIPQIFYTSDSGSGQNGLRQYFWKVFHMGADRSTVIAESEQSCFYVSDD